LALAARHEFLPPMSSFNVLYNGQKKTIKASPNVLMQAILAEAAEKFGLDPSKCTLHHKKVAIDKSQSVRFCGIPNLAQIELRLNESITTNVAATTANCRIALSVANENSCTGSFPSVTTLSEMLLLLVGQGGLKSEYLQSPHEIIYLRTAVTGDALKSTTLGNLGLTG
jgi:TUG ubiquitin-like domain